MTSERFSTITLILLAVTLALPLFPCLCAESAPQAAAVHGTQSNNPAEAAGAGSAPAENPNTLKHIAAALAIGLCALATGFAQAKIGAAGMGTMAEKPELIGRVILLVAIPETLVILGFVIAALILM